MSAGYQVFADEGLQELQSIQNPLECCLMFVHDCTAEPCNQCLCETCGTQATKRLQGYFKSQMLRLSVYLN